MNKAVLSGDVIFSVYANRTEFFTADLTHDLEKVDLHFGVKIHICHGHFRKS